jgi:hypothetical protein
MLRLIRCLESASSRLLLTKPEGRSSLSAGRVPRDLPWSGCGRRAPFKARTTITTRAPFTFRRYPADSGAAFAAGPTVGRGAPLSRPEPGFGIKSESRLASYVVRGAAVQQAENAFPIFGGERVQQLIRADHAGFDAGLGLLDEVSHLRGQAYVVDYADRSPHAGAPNRALLAPAPHDDHEITPAENRARDRCRGCGRRSDGVGSSSLLGQRQWPAFRVGCRLAAPRSRIAERERSTTVHEAATNRRLR